MRWMRERFGISDKMKPIEQYAGNHPPQKINADQHEIDGFQFDAKDAQGRFWECFAELSYRVSGDTYKLEQLDRLIGSTVDGRMVEIGMPDDKMMWALGNALDRNQEIYEAAHHLD